MYSFHQNQQQGTNNAPSSASSIPPSWIEAEENISTLVAAMITSLHSSGNNQNFTNSSNNNINKQMIEEIPSAQDTIGFMRSAVNILLQLWPEQQRANDQENEDEQQEILAYQSVQHVLFDASHELLRILWMFVVPPRNPWLASNMNKNNQQTTTQSSTSAPSLLASTDVKAAAFRAIKSIAILCARDSSGSLGFMFKDIVRGERGIHSITRCLCSAASTTEARSAAGELLLVLTLQLGMTEVKLPSGNNNLEAAPTSRQTFNFADGASSNNNNNNSDVIDINLLVSTTLAEPDANVRSYVLAAVQACIVSATSSSEASSSSPSFVIASLCSPSIVNSLLRLVSADDTSDVRCVAALAVQALMSAIPFIVLTTSSPARQRQSSSQKSSIASSSPPIISLSATDYLAVAESSIGRLYALLSPVTISYDFHKIDNTSSSSSSAIEEEIVALLQLLESVVLAAAAVGNEQVFVALRQRSVARTVVLRMNLGNRSAANASQSVVSAAVRCIRVMLELSPPFASQTAQLCDSTAMAALFKLVLALPTFAGNDASSSHLELQLVLGHILCFSAENRALAVREMSTKTINAFSGILRERCAMHISPSAVVSAYYSLPLTGIELRDENHSLLNDEMLSSLRFETTNLSIDEESARMILDGQQLRALPTINSSSSNNNSPASMRNSTSNNRVEVTEHWRSCNINKLLTGFMLSKGTGSNNNSSIAAMEQQQQKRVAILIGLVRFSVQSVLQAVIDLNESNMRNQQQYLNHENTHGDSFMSINNNNNNQSNSLTSTSNNRNKLSNVGVLFDGSNDESGSNNNNNNNANSTDPNDKLISDNSPIDLISSQDREYYDKYKFSRRQTQETNNNNNNSNGNPSGSAKRFLHGNTNLSPSNMTMPSIKQPQHQAERVLHQVNTSLYSEFDACVRLVLAFAEHFKDEDSTTNNQQQQPNKSSSFSKDPRQPHLMMRDNADTTRRKSSGNSTGNGTNTGANAGSSLSAAALRLRNPWDVKRVQHYDPKAWSIGAVQEGDLFYFSVQVISLNANVLEAIVAKARAHYVEIRKHLAVTPQGALNRRHFLSEMVTAVMPNVIALLQKLQRIVATQGEGHVQTALALNPELQQQNNVSNSNSNSNNATIDCGNVVPVVEFLLQYFSAKLYSMGISSSNQNKMLKRGGSRDNQNNNNNNNNHDQQQQQHQDVDEILASLGRKNSPDDAFDEF